MKKFVAGLVLVGVVCSSCAAIAATRKPAPPNGRPPMMISGDRPPMPPEGKRPTMSGDKRPPRPPMSGDRRPPEFDGQRPARQ